MVEVMSCDGCNAWHTKCSVSVVETSSIYEWAAKAQF